LRDHSGYGTARRSRPRTLWLCFAFALAAQAARSQQADAGQLPIAPRELKNMSLEELSQIEVTTPSKEPVKAFQTAAAIYVITGEDIQRSGATSIPEALRMAPGVEVARIDANKWSVGIRGFGSRLTRSVLVLIDGRTVFTPLFDGTYWEVQDTMMEDIDRIEVIRGPGGTIWGPNAVNGVINIITKSSTLTQGMLVSAGGGNEEQGFLNFRYGGGNGRDLTYRIYGKSFTRAPAVHGDSGNYDDWRAAQTGFRMDWKKSDRDAFTLQGDLYREDAGERVQAVSYTLPFSRIVDSNAMLSGGNIMARWQRNSGDGNDFQLQAYFDRTNRLESNLGDVRNTFDVDFVQRRRLPARNQLSWGLGARIDPVSNTEVVSGLTFVPNRRTDYLLTAFVQDDIGLVERRLTLTAGTKLLRTNFTEGGVQWEPSARLLWTPSEIQSVWAAYTHALRTPSDAEGNFNLSGYIGNSAAGTPFFARFNANPNFTSEQLNGYELGYRRLLGRRLFVDASGFYNHYHDLFSEDITGQPFVEASPGPTHLLLPAQFGNGLLGTTKGAEVAPEWRPFESWRLRGSYSYLHMNLGRAPGSADVGTAQTIQTSSPQHEVTVQSPFNLTRQVELDLTYRYVSALAGQMAPAYSTGDARIAWRVRRYCELSFAGRNLLQPSHIEYGSDPGPPVGIRRSVYARITWSK
jgi:iron complex outermembrane receptor protein